MGMLTGDIEHYFIRPCPGRLGAFDPAHAETIRAALRQEALARMAKDGFAPDETELLFSLDLRFVGQDSAIPVPLPERLHTGCQDELRRGFIERYERLYQYASSDEVESTSIRLVARGIRRNKLSFGSLKLPARKASAAAGHRQVNFGPEDGWVSTPVLMRNGLSGKRVGPLIIESDDSTVVIPPNVTVSADKGGNLLAELPRKAPVALPKRKRANA
jgi:N-methylhydantoinase A